MLQTAVYAGIKEIYFLGMDFNFHKELREDGSVIIKNGVKNHMDYMPQEYSGIYNVTQIEKGYRRFKEYADCHEISVYNATRGGKLEIFDRVDFDSLF